MYLTQSQHWGTLAMGRIPLNWWNPENNKIRAKRSRDSNKTQGNKDGYQRLPGLRKFSNITCGEDP